MITATLTGGLGNQMFIYAMVRAMALRNQTGMAFDIRRGFATDYRFHRALELQHFNLQLPQAKIATYDYLGNFGEIIRKISHRLGRNILLPQYKQFYETSDSNHINFFQEQIVRSKARNVYLYGYWQSERYFSDFADVIRRDFTIKTRIPSEVRDELHKLQFMGRPLVMMGVRRYQECKGICSMEDAACDADYYLNAMAYVRKRLNNPLFVVFSQDHAWLHSFLPSKDIYIVKARSGYLSAISDLFIMTNCHHAIISNSTYYWWGAWLQKKSDDHIVVAPNNFFNRDSICNGWTVINN